MTPAPAAHTTIGRAIVKLTWAVDPATGALERAAPAPLVADIEDDGLEPRLPPHSDYWPERRYVDVAVVGAAHAAGGRPVTERIVSVSVAGREKALRVHGRRAIAFGAGGAVRIEPAEPFTEMPLGIEHAYGGLDGRAPFDRDDPQQALAVATRSDWPGLYPRNPWGRGYLCVPDPIEGLEMPTQEDPDHPLTAEGLVVDPRRWYWCPMPAYLDWTPVNCFPRNLFLTLDCDPWFLPPQDETLFEIRAGLLPSGYRAHLEDQRLGMPPHWRFFQEAAPGLSFPPEQIAGAPVRIEGMHPEHDVLEWRIPPAPEVWLAFEDVHERVDPALAAVEIRPGRLEVSLTYTAEIRAPRVFLPGVHPTIPFGAVVDRSEPIWFDAPPTVKSYMAGASAGEEEGKGP